MLIKEKSHLGYELVRSLKRNFFHMGLIDHGLPIPVRMKRGTILVLALDLAKELKEKISDKRVGVVLPSGAGGVIANLGLMLADKIPVNLNFQLY